jgi:hypothetical protein
MLHRTRVQLTSRVRGTLLSLASPIGERHKSARGATSWQYDLALFPPSPPISGRGSPSSGRRGSRARDSNSTSRVFLPVFCASDGSTRAPSSHSRGRGRADARTPPSAPPHAHHGGRRRGRAGVPDVRLRPLRRVGGGEAVPRHLPPVRRIRGRARALVGRVPLLQRDEGLRQPHRRRHGSLPLPLRAIRREQAQDERGEDPPGVLLRQAQPPRGARERRRRHRHGRRVPRRHHPRPRRQHPRREDRRRARRARPRHPRSRRPAPPRGRVRVPRRRRARPGRLRLRQAPRPRRGQDRAQRAPPRARRRREEGRRDRDRPRPGRRRAHPRRALHARSHLRQGGHARAAPGGFCRRGGASPPGSQVRRRGVRGVAG